MVSLSACVTQLANNEPHADHTKQSNEDNIEMSPANSR
jgi:hypothetical protein